MLEFMQRNCPPVRLKQYHFIENQALSRSYKWLVKVILLILWALENLVFTTLL